MQIRGYAGFWIIIACAVGLSVWALTLAAGAADWGLWVYWCLLATVGLLFACKTFRDMRREQERAVVSSDTPSI